jgi:putative chitinase
MLITSEQLLAIIGEKKINTVNKLINPLNDCLVKFEINTPLRISHFLAQVLHESGCFYYRKELASGSAYEGRKDLGNNVSGYGVKYKGRAFIQITGYNNYKLFGEYAKIDCLNQPELLESDNYVFLASGWFWDTHKLNLLADKDDITTITKRINGGLNGFDDRKQWLTKCKAALMK